MVSSKEAVFVVVFVDASSHFVEVDENDRTPESVPKGGDET